MNVTEFKKLIRHFSETNVTVDEPHASMRCEENNLTVERVKKIIIDQNSRLIRIIEDRPKVYKLYYFISKKRELKIVVDLYEQDNINIRTVKILSTQFRIGIVKRQRF